MLEAIEPTFWLLWTNNFPFKDDSGIGFKKEVAAAIVPETGYLANVDVGVEDSRLRSKPKRPEKTIKNYHSIGK